MVEPEPAMRDEAAENLAIGALGFIASQPELLHRFLALTGLEPAEIRKAAGEPGFLAGILDFLMEHESTMLTYALSINRSPHDFVRARRALSGPRDEGS